jgi:hypothetical protein
MLNFKESSFRYEPYPIGYTSKVLDDSVYREMLSKWPATDLFLHRPDYGDKYALSELNNPKQYRQFVKANPVWGNFHEYVKDKRFIRETLEFLRQHQIDLGVFWKNRRLKAFLHSLAGKTIPSGDVLSARFEFSMMPAKGGCIRPHTDASQKIITLVLSMMAPGEWNPAWGGGTDVLRPKDTKRNYNQINRYMEFDEVEVLQTFPFEPNQCVTFIKTFNSWHSVSPMTGADGVMRRTLTLNIEKLN